MSWSQRYPTINNADAQQRLAKMINLGTVFETDYENARVKVTVGNWTTTWLPWLTATSSGDINWRALEVGEQVLVLCPSGDMAQGIVLGSVYQQQQQQVINDIPLGSRQNVQRFQFQDGTILEYDREHHILNADVKGDVQITATGNLTANISKNAAINAENIELNANSDIKIKAGGTLKMNASHISAQE